LSPREGRTSWRQSAGQSVEDEGDIPMRSSLSPQKTPGSKPDSDLMLTKAGTYLPSLNLSPITSSPTGKLKPSARPWRHSDVSPTTQTTSYSAFRNDDDNEVAAANLAGDASRRRNSGKQRRNVNLSHSSTLLTRRADVGGGASPVRGGPASRDF